jgi:mannose-1-phosphate guanylyltransferase
VVSIVLAGGSGKRFWPLSRLARPKQFLRLFGERSLIAETVARVGLPGMEHPPVVVSTAPQAPLVRESLAGLPHRLVAEPVGRNTAPAVALALTWACHLHGDPVVGIFPSDHFIPDLEDFRRHYRAAVRFALETDRIVTLGLVPTRPETGYGYIHRSVSVLCAEGDLEFHDVEGFKEKPALPTAAAYLAEGTYLWNSGMFVARARTLLEEIRCHQPAIGEPLAGLEPLLGTARGDEELARLFPTLPAVSLDYGVMERTRRIGVLPARFAWSDVGSWNALLPFAQGTHGNFVRGPAVVSHDCRSVVAVQERSDQHLLALCGLSNVGVIQTDDVTLVVDLDRSQDVRDLLTTLESDPATREKL